jgi:hypothetical protein
LVGAATRNHFRRRRGDYDVVPALTVAHAHRVQRANGAAGQHSNVLQHRLAPVAEAWRLDGRNLETATQFIDDERRERLAFNILSNDEKRFAGLHNSGLAAWRIARDSAHL